MEKSIFLDYPNNLNKIFDKLDNFNIKPIIVGGYIRDKLLNLDSNDIDIELYGVDSLNEIETILAEFGSVCSVGKSFGVVKLTFKDLEIDFSLPREDSKVADGHRGFLIKTDKNLSFKEAASRRDFTINAIGFDTIEKRILDPFHGLRDIEQKILRAVDEEKFSQDPLRILRAVGFAARFEFKIEQTLFHLCRSMIEENALEELPQERILKEFEKFLLKSTYPSLAINLLKDFGTFSFFGEFSARDSLDYFAQKRRGDSKINLLIFFTLLYDGRDLQGIEKLIQEKKMLKTIELFRELKESISLQSISNYSLYKLATKVNIEHFLYYLDASFIGKKQKEISILKKRAIALNIFNRALEPLILGRDLLSLDLTPSKHFKEILNATYEAQMREEFSSKEEALLWVKSYLKGI